MSIKKILAKVVGIKQTKGPTVFFLYNLKETIKAAAFAGKGERAYPKIKQGSIVKVELEESEDGKYTIKSMEIANEEEKEKFSSEENEKLKNMLKTFKTYSKIDEKMLSEFEKMKEILKDIVLSKEGKIYIKHHADIDGYFSSLLMDEMLNNLFKKIGISKEKLIFPLKKPFYDISNAFFDKCCIGKKDLLIILDNGGCEEDVLPMKLLKENEVKIVVVDHHSSSEEWEERREEHPADILILPSENLREVCTTALVFELGYYFGLLDEKYLEFVKIAVLADKCGEKIEKIYKINEKEKKKLDKKRWRCDFIIFHTNPNVYSFLKEVVEKNSFEILDNEIERIKREKVKEMEKIAEVLNSDHALIYFINLNLLSKGYPPDGRKTGIFFEMVKNKKDRVGVVSFRDDMMILRLSDKFEELKKSRVEKFVKNEEFANLIVIGGHENAYSIKFPPFLKEKLLNIVRREVWRR